MTGRQAFNPLVQNAHLLARADQDAPGSQIVNRGTQGFVFPAQAGMLQGALDKHDQSIDLEGFLDVVERPELHRFHCGGHRGVGGHHDDRSFHTGGANFPD